MAEEEKIKADVKVLVDEFGEALTEAFNKIHEGLVALKPRIDECGLSEMEKVALWRDCTHSLDGRMAAINLAADIDL